MDQDSGKAAKNLGVQRDEMKPTSELSANEDEEVGGCGYQGYEFGAGTYPDSICMEGRLFDADDCDDQGRLSVYEDDEDIPCPVCRPANAIDYWTKRNQLSGATKQAARKAAKSLVASILQNRGLLVNTQQTSEQKGTSPLPIKEYLDFN